MRVYMDNKVLVISVYHVNNLKDNTKENTIKSEYNQNYIQSNFRIKDKMGTPYFCPVWRSCPFSETITF